LAELRSFDEKVIEPSLPVSIVLGVGIPEE